MDANYDKLKYYFSFLTNKFFKWTGDFLHLKIKQLKNQITINHLVVCCFVDRTQDLLIFH